MMRPNNSLDGSGRKAKMNYDGKRRMRRHSNYQKVGIS